MWRPVRPPPAVIPVPISLGLAFAKGMGFTGTFTRLGVIRRCIYVVVLGPPVHIRARCALFSHEA